MQRLAGLEAGPAEAGLAEEDTLSPVANLDPTSLNLRPSTVELQISNRKLPISQKKPKTSTKNRMLVESRLKAIRTQIFRDSCIPILPRLLRQTQRLPPDLTLCQREEDARREPRTRTLGLTKAFLRRMHQTTLQAVLILPCRLGPALMVL